MKFQWKKLSTFAATAVITSFGLIYTNPHKAQAQTIISEGKLQGESPDCGFRGNGTYIGNVYLEPGMTVNLHLDDDDSDAAIAVYDSSEKSFSCFDNDVSNLETATLPQDLQPDDIIWVGSVDDYGNAYILETQ